MRKGEYYWVKRKSARSWSVCEILKVRKKTIDILMNDLKYSLDINDLTFVRIPRPDTLNPVLSVNENKLTLDINFGGYVQQIPIQSILKKIMDAGIIEEVIFFPSIRLGF